MDNLNNYLKQKNPTIFFDDKIVLHDFYEDPETKELKEHVYIVDGKDTNYTSSTTFIHNFFPEFPQTMIISNILKSKNPNPKYKGKTFDEIKKMWEDNGKEARDLGTIMHNQIEKFYNIPSLWENQDDLNLFYNKEEINTTEFNYFLIFHNEVVLKNEWIPFRTECRIFDRIFRISGSIDMLYKSPKYTENNKELILIDWKRSKEIKKENKYKKGFFPINDLPDCNFIHYSLQLNLYKEILERNTDYKIIFMALAVFHPNQSKPVLKQVDDMKSYIDKMISHKLLNQKE